ncbi:hypothetical protein N7478_012668 [Penicillium angulare]|uniref:uncharacterized protein n=1 Tax=Penicillium angulare TaxID=116970 RepID=UPI0025417AF1|nr:uncharacterized protein N7478_012668 [Penicillium angulare]KAJ5256564.1 hypothetical protein N7478_012668 [Penicillium angulare]
MSRTFIDVVYNGELASLHDDDLIRLLYTQFTPEIDHLKNVPRAVEKADQNKSGPEGNITEKALSPSRLLFGEDFDEVNRTITNVRAVKWLLANEYEAFSANQAVKLSAQTFKAFRDRALLSLNDPDNLVALVVALVVGDMGKDPHLADEIAALSGVKSNENHDTLLAQAVGCGMLDKPLSLLSNTRREDVILGIRVGAVLNIPQLMQGENVPGSLKPVLQFRDHLSAFTLKYLEIIFDVAGAAGHIDSRSAKRMIEPVCESFLQAWPILEAIVTSQTSHAETSLKEAYDQVLQNRGRLVNQMGFLSVLSTSNPAERALLRLFAMGRVADQETADQVQKAFTTLPEIECLVQGLNVNGIDDGEAILLYYMPALFAGTLQAVPEPEERTEALTSLMRFMVRLFDGSKPQPGTAGSIKECDVSAAVDFVRSSDFRPRFFDGYTLPVGS